MHFNSPASSLSCLVWTYAKQPKVLNIYNRAISLQIFRGVLKFNMVELRRRAPAYQICCCDSASAQNAFGSFAPMIMHRILSRKVLLNLSAKPFCWGSPGTVMCLNIPPSAHRSMNSFDKNSIPLSVLMALILLPDWVSISVSHSLNFLKVWSLLASW